MDIPKFNLTANALDISSEEDLAAELAKDSGGKRFDPGSYRLKIAKAVYHVKDGNTSPACAKDPTWFNVRITLEGTEDRTKDKFLQVPTSKVKYGPKGTLFVFKQFMEFMASIGEAVTLNNLGKLCEKYFSSEDALNKLVGKELDADIGFDGPHLEPEGDGYKIVLKTGPIQEDGETVVLPDRGSAKVFAEAKGIKITYPEFLKFHSAVKAKPAGKAEGWD